MMLSILIPTLPERNVLFYELCLEIENQIKIFSIHTCIEVLYDSRGKGEVTTGQKRNDLIKKASGDYIWMIDDDDMIMPNAILNIITGIIKHSPDVFGINGIMTTNGANEMKWDIRLGNPYALVDGKYLRYPNHITPMKRKLIKDIKFKDITHGEDYEWATRINNLGILKTQHIIEEPMYHYKFIHK